MPESTTVATPLVPASQPVPPTVFFVVLSVGWLLVVGIWSLLYWQFPYQSGTVFIHYNTYFGVDAIGPWSQLLWLPGTATIIAIVHTLIALLARTRNAFLTQLVLWGLVVLAAILLSALWSIILINR